MLPKNEDIIQTSKKTNQKDNVNKEVFNMLRKRIAIMTVILLLSSVAACSINDNQGIADTISVQSNEKAVKLNDSTNDDGVSYTEESSEQISEASVKSEDSSSSDKKQTSEKQSSGSSDNKNNSAVESSKTSSESSSSKTRKATDNSTVSNGTSNSVSNASSEKSSSDTKASAASNQTETSDTESVTASQGTIKAENNKTVTISEAGTYTISGTASNFTVKVAADKDSKVQLDISDLNVTNDNFPVIYVLSADKCYINTTGSSSTLSVTGSFTSDGDTNTDAVIFSKDDLVFSGTGTLNIVSNAANGISGKDDIKFNSGIYSITSAKDSIEANDSITVTDGTFNINTNKDGLHCENDDDDTVGSILIQGGSFTIKAASDAIQATTTAQIDGGTFNLTGSEGIEATIVIINNGKINITASDDGINAAQKSRSAGTPTIEINGGELTIVMGQGDTDAIDANGNIVVNGGTINITAQMSSFDYDGTAQYNGGTIIINGTQVDSIPQSMMGGGRGGMNGGNFGGNMQGNMGGFGGRGGRMF